MTISIRLSDEETRLIKKYAQLNHQTVSALVRDTLLDRIETEYDLKLFKEALLDYERDSFELSHEDIKKELDF